MANEKKWRIYYCKTDWIFDDLIARVGIPKLVIRRCGIYCSFKRSIHVQSVRKGSLYIKLAGRCR
jgi:hypothetical protein